MCDIIDGCQTDHILHPVQAEGTQTNITNFFSGNIGAGAFAPRVRDQNKSKRMETALMSLHRQTLASKDQQQPISLKRHGSSILVDSASEDDEPAAITSLNGKTLPPVARKHGKVARKSKVAQPQAKKTKTKAKKNARDSDEFDDSDVSDRAGVMISGNEDVEDEMNEGSEKTQPTKSRTKSAPKKSRGITRRKRKTGD